MTKHVGIFFCLGVHLNAYQKGNIVMSNTTAGEAQEVAGKEQITGLLTSLFK